MKYCLLCLLLIWSFSVQAKVTAKHCAGLDTKISRIESKLRAGYDLAKGERLKARLRELSKLRYQCRKKRIPTGKNNH